MEQTPLEWLKRLAERLQGEQPALVRRAAYYDGPQPLPDVPDGAKQEFRRLLDMSRANFVRVIVDSIADRMRVDGFKTDRGDDVDQALWALWRASSMPARSFGAHVDSLVKSRAYALVWPRVDAPTIPRISVEDACQVIHESDAEDPDVVLAALKVWTDDLVDVERANVYLPDGIHKFERKRGQHGIGLHEGWTELGDAFVPAPEVLAGRVPVVPLVNREDVNAGGLSEIDEVIPVQDRISKILFDRVIASEFGAFRQRWATGLELPVNPETNQPIETQEAALKRLMVNPEPDGKFGTFEATDLRPYLDAVEQDLVMMSRMSSIPPHYLTTKGEFPSGDAVRSSEAPLIAKVTSKHDLAGDDWERAMRIAGDIAGLEFDTVETVWRNPETRTYGDAADYALKLKNIGIPLPLIMQRLGFTSDEIRDAAVNADAALLLRQVLGAVDTDDA